MPHFKFCNFQVVTDILQIHGQKLTAYKGDYDTYERTRMEQLKNQQKAFESNERSRAHMQVFHHTNSYYLHSTQSTFFSFLKLLFCLFLHCFGKVTSGGSAFVYYFISLKITGITSGSISFLSM